MSVHLHIGSSVIDTRLGNNISHGSVLQETSNASLSQLLMKSLPGTWSGGTACSIQIVACDSPLCKFTTQYSGPG